jgi:hypothetical protein
MLCQHLCEISALLILNLHFLIQDIHGKREGIDFALESINFHIQAQHNFIALVQN